MLYLYKLVKCYLELAFEEFDKVDPKNCSKTDSGDTDRILGLVKQCEK